MNTMTEKRNKLFPFHLIVFFAN